MPKVTDDHRRLRHMQILTAAYQCFGRNGVHQTTMRDICNEADLSTGAVYNYFEGKDEIVEAIARESSQSVDALFEAVDVEQPAPEVIAEVLERLSEVIEQTSATNDHRVQVRLWGEALHEPSMREAVCDNQSDLVGRIETIVKRGQRRGEVDPEPEPSALSRAVVALYQGSILQKALDPDADGSAPLSAVVSLLRPNREAVG